MSHDTKLDNLVIIIKTTIDNIDIKAQNMSLATPIELTGELKVTELMADLKKVDALTATDQELEKPLLIIGVDEAGRGPLLGSVNVAAALLPSAWSGLIEDKPLADTPLSIMTDSKQLSEKKRDLLYPLVQEQALAYVIAEVPAAVIDQVNILQATMIGMRLCTEVLIDTIATQLSKDDTVKPFQVVVLYDGNRCPELSYSKLSRAGIEHADIDCQAWIKGDARHTSIAAASILAKVSRDQTMYQLDNQYPAYGIAKHKGYPTRAHVQAIQDYGVLNEHRRSFSPIKQALLNLLESK